MIDVRRPEDVLDRIQHARRRFEKGGQVPNATRELIVELTDALADSGPLELGISAGRWLRTWKSLKGAAESARNGRAEVQVREAIRGLRAALRTVQLAAWSRRWRRRFGGSPRARRIQFFAVPALLAAAVGAVLESAFQPGVFRPIFLAVGPVVLLVLWLAVFDDTSARLGDAALAREAASQVAGGQRALLWLRLVSYAPGTDEVVIATDQNVLSAGRGGKEPWRLMWSVPYEEITSASREKSDTPHLMLRTVDGERALECRQLSGQTARDYQGKLREALVAILERRAQPRHRVEADSSE